MLFFVLHEGFEFFLINLHGVIFGEVVKSWVDIIIGKLLCVVNGAKFLYVVDVGS